MALNLGGIIRLTYAVKSEGVLTNPSGVTLTVEQPDGVVITVTNPTIDITPADTGQLVYDFLPTQAGLHQVRWLTTGPTSSGPYSFVAEAPGRMLVSVDEAIDHLNSRNVTTSDDDREKLEWLCLVVSEAVEDDLGRSVVRKPFTETHSGGLGAIVLRHSPILSITSVTVSGVVLDPSGYWLDDAAPILRAGAAYSWGYFGSGARNVVIAGFAGYANPPKSARMVALTALQAMWQQSQQASHIALDESAELAVSSAVAGLPDPLRSAYESLRAVGIA